MTWYSETERSDGLTINKRTDDTWEIRHLGVLVTACPCCDKPLVTARAARLVADACYTPPPEAA